ncbi:MAG: hypothetical protein BGP24_14765 [Lysobacterales bacterium 69-70]|nr:hypothetical protein [Xanthomonadaceae bacterium]ODU35347.1 MAG: hypothetical protein ABS97_05595 [Xanthomonadaceae bacterium SCN 69-320]ODV17189.1 MAG: hypothetical protein ABT27_17645 [Xanthomonadaceae bacterium SCN 69-25]OJY94244.1 MAG: hypothetical protein BGP24_14765 [Xanthomonadales bacterium 69-70]
MASVGNRSGNINPAELPKCDQYGIHDVLVTPEIAQVWLGYNRNNRNLNDKRVEQYAEEMLAGAWKANGDSIRFSKSQKLLDGQHRLNAIIRSGKAQRCIIVVGLDDETQVTVDTGKKRAPSDVLNIEGVGYWDALQLATAMHVIINVHAGLQWHSTVRRTNHEIRDFWLEHPKITQSLEHIRGLPRHYPPLHHSKAIALHYFFAMRDPAAADQFMDDLFTGASLASSDPVYQLRERLIAARNAGESLKPHALWHAVIKAWNLRRKGRRVTSARSIFPRTGDEFPTVL